MIRKGEIIVAIDPRLRDMYCCEVLESGEENKENLLCKIRFMIAYPIQYEPGHPESPHENTPYLDNQICRLEFVRRVETPDRSYHDYETSFDRCLADYTDRRAYLYASLKHVPPACRHAACPDPYELEILARHAKREFTHKRAGVLN